MLSSTFWHVLAKSILFVAFGQTIAFSEAKMLCLKAIVLRAKALLPKVNLLLAKALLQKAALLDWSAPGLTMSSAHSPTFTSLHLRHSSFSNLSVASPTSKLILQPFRRFTYVTAHSPTLPLHHIRHSSFSNPSFASPTWQALHLIYLASRPWHGVNNVDIERLLFASPCRNTKCDRML